MVRAQASASKALFARPAQAVKLGSCILGFAEPSSSNDLSCQLEVWDVVSPEDARFMTPLSSRSHFDLNFNRGVNFAIPISPEYGQCVPPAPAECDEFVVRATAARLSWRVQLWAHRRRVCPATPHVGHASVSPERASFSAVSPVWRCAVSCRSRTSPARAGPVYGSSCLP